MKSKIWISFILIILLSNVLSARTYNLKNYLALVEKFSKDLKLAGQEQEMAKVNKKQAISLAFPKIAAKADYTRNLTDYFMFVDASFLGQPGQVAKFKVKRDNELSANLALQQTLFSPTVGNAITAAKQYQKLTDFIYDASYQAIMNVAKTLFYQTLLAEKFWQVMQSSEQNAHENYDNMKLKFENGVVSEFELLQAEVRWKNAIPETAKAKRNHEMALNNLKNLAGIPIEEPIELDGNFKEIPPMPDRISLDIILKRRPDYNAQLWEEKLRQTNVRVKYAAFFPTLTGTLVYAYSAQSDYWKIEQDNGLLMAGLSVSVPLFTGGYRRSEVQKAKVELTKAQISIDKSKESIYNEISNIYLQLNEAYERITTAEAIIKTAEKAFKIAGNTVQSGLATQLQLKDARVGFDQANMNYYAAVFDYLNAYFQWEKAVGKVSE